MSRHRIQALLRKEWLDLRRNPGALLPVLVVAAIALILPFVIGVMLPAMTGDRLGDDRDLLRVSRYGGAAGGLSPDGRVQFFLMQQFLLLFLLTPITGAMALAAHSIVGEKQARTLEPLLATPVSTVELLVAKVVGALWPSLAISLVSAMVFLGGLHWLAQPGVAAAMLNARTLLLLFFVGPSASLVAVQAAIVVSSRVNDARTAQQVGVLLIVPITALLVAQFTGAFWLANRALVLIGFGLLAWWLALLAASVWLFRRETILTRWR